jgi:pimeloyl-ACP methyl ester carboxylesterase
MSFLRFFLSFCTVCFGLNCFAEQECVILLHGFGKSSRSMNSIASYLAEHNYKVINVDYPSRKHDIQTLIEKKIAPQAQECLNKKSKIHFVGYSMGGVIAKNFIDNHNITNLGKLVLIASPIRGSDISSILSKNSFFRIIFGPAVSDLSFSSKLFQTPEANLSYPIGIIKANKSHNPLTSLFLLKGPNDGTITHASTHIDGAKDIIQIDANHNSIIYLDETKKQILHFLQTSNFIR